ncbi:MAG: HAD family hydrolase [Parachlamydiaceae bacterium]|nr:HAD family hydrolase [Parachlamydiaceae bacterium]
MRPFPAQLKALLVDFDGTLIDSLSALWNCYQTFMHRHGQMATQEEFMMLAGPSLDEIIIYLKSKYNLSADYVVLYEEYRELVVESYAKDGVLFPEALEVLQSFKNLGVKLALVTSASSGLIEPFIRRTNLINVFDAIVTHIDGEETKPSPEIYKRAMKYLDITPENAIAVEDSKNGVLSAHGANLYVVQFAGTSKGSSNVNNQRKLENASHTVYSWRELGKFCDSNF